MQNNNHDYEVTRSHHIPPPTGGQRREEFNLEECAAYTHVSTSSNPHVEGEGNGNQSKVPTTSH